MDFRLMALEMANDDVVLLLERVASLEADVDVYREIAQQAIHVAHDVTADRDRLRRRGNQRVEDIRPLRAQDRRAARRSTASPSAACSP